MTVPVRSKTFHARSKTFPDRTDPARSRPDRLFQRRATRTLIGSGAS